MGPLRRRRGTGRSPTRGASVPGATSTSRPPCRSGSGLSSSSALAVALTLALADGGGLRLESLDAAHLRSPPRPQPPACPAGSWTSSRRCSAGPGTRCSSTAATTRSHRSPIPRDRSRCSSCTAGVPRTLVGSRVRDAAGRVRSGRAALGIALAARRNRSTRCRRLAARASRRRRERARARDGRRAPPRRPVGARPAPAREPRQPARRLRGVDSASSTLLVDILVAERRGRCPAHRRRVRRMRRRARATQPRRRRARARSTTPLPRRDRARATGLRRPRRRRRART